MSLLTSRNARLNPPAGTLTWEGPATICLLGLVLVVTMPLLVQVLGARLTAGIWAWPDLGPAYLGLVDGEFGHGLPPRVATHLPSTALLWACTGLAEMIALTIVGLATWCSRASVGGGPGTGLATRAEARRALGRAPLRRKQGVIRPDLSRSRRMLRRGGR